MKKGELAELAKPGVELHVRVTPNSARNELRVVEGMIKVSVTAVPEDGKATKSVIKLLSKALGLPKSKLVLLRGATHRNKVFLIQDY
ncbi:MAG: DUF167 domain-containing protein [Maritimibacter sp.]